MAFGPHPVDKVLFKVSLGSIALLTLMSIISTVTVKDAVCWCPVHFTGSHVAYTHRTCASSSSTKQSFDEWYNETPKPEVNSSSSDYKQPNNQGVYYNLAVEAVISCLAFLVLCHVASTAAIGTIGGKPTYGISISYFVAEILASVGWLCLYLYHPESPEAGDPFLCDFKVRRLGNDHRYTVQCLPGVDTMLHYVFSMNKILCIAMAMLVIVHVINMFILVPLLKMLNRAGAAKPNQSDAADYGGCHGCTDQFIMSVLNTGNGLWLGAQVGSSQEPGIAVEDPHNIVYENVTKKPAQL